MSQNYIKFPKQDPFQILLYTVCTCMRQKQNVWVYAIWQWKELDWYHWICIPGFVGREIQ